MKNFGNTIKFANKSGTKRDLIQDTKLVTNNSTAACTTFNLASATKLISKK